MRVYSLRSEAAVQQIAALFAGIALYSVHLVTISDRAPWRSTTPWLLDGALVAATQQGCTTLAWTCIHHVRNDPHGLARLAARRGSTLVTPGARHTVTLLLTAAAAPPPRVAFDLVFVDATTVQSTAGGQPVISNELFVTTDLNCVSDRVQVSGTTRSHAVLRSGAPLELADWLAHTAWGRLYRNYQQSLFGSSAWQERANL